MRQVFNQVVLMSTVVLMLTGGQLAHAAQRSDTLSVSQNPDPAGEAYRARHTRSCCKMGERNRKDIRSQNDRSHSAAQTRKSAEAFHGQRHSIALREAPRVQSTCCQKTLSTK
jgi:hypothetical protein